MNSSQVLTALSGGDEAKMKQLMERAAKALPLGRVGKPEGIAAAVFYIASQVSQQTF
jgi:NAD(P)-dependent dehydrogenase (short-subunit alcohol dehydrogenase family)